jgi:hypothetical protein
MTTRKSATTACVWLLLLLLPTGQAQSGNAYQPDEMILHLWHLDETTGSYRDDNGRPEGDPRNVPLTVINGTQGVESFYGFGKAFRPAGPSGASAAAPDLQSLYQGADGSFTVEAIIQPASITSGIQMIVTREGAGGNENRSFQFRITAAGELDFQGIGSGDGRSAIPTTGPNAFVAGSGAWYHVAVTCDAVLRQGTLYWTRLAPDVKVANALASFTFTGIAGTKLGHTAIGTQRRSNTNVFTGLIDEVAISSVAWPASEFLFPIEIGGVVELSSPSPSESQVGVALGITLSWMGSPVTVDPRYAVRFGTDPNITKNPQIAAELAEARLNLYRAVGNLKPNTQYYWQVNVTDAGAVHEGRIWSFTTGSGDVPGQLAVDKQTLHMWRFENTTGPALDHAYADPEDPNRLDLPEVVGDREAASFYNCGKAFLTARAGANSDPKGASIGWSVPQGGYQGADGAFTIEAIIKVEDLGGIQQIFSRENDGGTDVRTYQFRINSGQLEFAAITTQVTGEPYKWDIPKDGVHAFSPDGWYHVAVTYNGTPGTAPRGGKVYWTRIVPGVVMANQIGEFAMTTDYADTHGGITAIAVHRRGGYRDALKGLVDEVRISSVARAPGDMFLPAEFPPTLQASDPSPADGAERVSPQTVLRWVAPTFTDKPIYTVRLGTDPDTLKNAEIATGISATVWDVNGLLEEGTTYYWSVDASNGATYRGDTWSFTTYTIPANLSGPYTPDANTLHLWHLERQLVNPPALSPSDWFLDSAFPDSNDPALWTDLVSVHGTRRDSLPGFGYAFKSDFLLGAPAGAASESSEPQAKFQGPDGSFTCEAIVKVDDLVGAYVDQGMRLIDRNVEGNAFELSILNGTLLFVSATMPDAGAYGQAAIPTEGIHAFHPDRWYHVAVTYDGTSQQGKLYWTEMFSGADQANLIGEFTMAPLSGSVTSSTILAFGGGTGGTYLVGLIDEVRISRIARGPGDFFFGPVPEPKPGN